jgi:hypothetical protein
MNKNIQTLLQHPALWQASNQAAGQQDVLPTGYASLDAQLHLNGWPGSGYTELLLQQQGISELQLLMPALRQLAKQRPIVLINPPFLPYAPAWQAQGLNLSQLLLIRTRKQEEALWSSEQLLRCGHVAAVLNWFARHSISYPQQRRLQLAAQDGQSWAIAFRDSTLAQQSSAAKLRLTLSPRKQQLHINILKQPGGWAGQQLALARPQMQASPSVQNWQAPASNSSRQVPAAVTPVPAPRQSKQKIPAVRGSNHQQHGL